MLSSLSASALDFAGQSTPVCAITYTNTVLWNALLVSGATLHNVNLTDTSCGHISLQGRRSKTKLLKTHKFNKGKTSWTSLGGE